VKITAEAVFGLLALGLLAALVLTLGRDGRRRRWRRAVSTAQWEDAHYTEGGLTRVVVQKVARLPSGEQRELETLLVASIPADAPDWRSRFEAARIAAYDRAISLNQPTLN
jgi:hypothetical protein